MSDPKKSPTPAQSSLPTQVTADRSTRKGLVFKPFEVARILLITTAAFAAIFIAYLVFSATNEVFATLFSQLDRDDASGVVAKLKEMKVPYKLSQRTGATIEVPEAKSPRFAARASPSSDCRAAAASASRASTRCDSAPPSSSNAFSIAARSKVSSRAPSEPSRVSNRLAYIWPDAQKSVFVSRTEPASASIVVKMMPGHTIEPQEVGGIIHLAKPRQFRVSRRMQSRIVTTDGIMLSSPRENKAKTDRAKTMATSLRRHTRSKFRCPIAHAR